ncbi:MAG: hypothetical protein KKC68_08600, partial [Candidatus Thermoplasmatota archaeon]|nr:hypothetical protein [Candidatus Thermoplasmatota archaeon]
LRTPILTKKIVEEILTDVKKQREHYLCTTDIPTILDSIGEVTEQWLNPLYKGRQLAREILPVVTGFSKEMIDTWGFGRFLSILKKENFPIFNKLNHENFQEFSAHGDGWVKAYGSHQITHSNVNPTLIGHICAGNIIGIGAIEIIMDKLIDAATWVKPPSEEPVFTALYARSIEEIDPHLAYTIAVLPYESKNTALNEFLFSQSDLIRATGGELARRNLTALSQKYNTPVAGHWHKLSFITIAREYLNKRARDVAELVSLDVSAWDQQGCFSPHEIFVEEGGKTSPLEFARILAEEMEVTAKILPKGIRSGKMQILDGYHRFFKKQLMGEPVKIFQSRTKDWLVIYDEASKGFEPSPQFRVIRVQPVSDILAIVPIIRPLGQFLQTTGVAIPNDRLLPFANAVGEVGVTNIRAISSMTLQKSWEPWDGRFPLHELFELDGIRWVSISARNIEAELKACLQLKRTLS